MNGTPSFQRFPLAMIAFSTRTPERELPWLLIIPAPGTDSRTVLSGTAILREDGWLPVASGDTPDVAAWTCRVVGEDVYFRQHGGEPQRVQQTDVEWRGMILADGGLCLVFNPFGSVDDPIEDTATSPFCLCARAALENPS